MAARAQPRLISFATNTNWQAYSGEATLSYLTQMLGLGALNFLSAATGVAGVLALIRGLTRRSAATLGNAWADLTRAVLYVLSPVRHHPSTSFNAGWDLPMGDHNPLPEQAAVIDSINRY